MALNIPSFADPRDPTHPITPAYGWLSFLALDLSSDAGRVDITVNPSEATWQARPIAVLSLALGKEGVPTLDTLMADPEFAAAFNTIGGKLYALAVAHHPSLAGATLI